MPLDSDVALLGTGVAPLIAANHLIAQGKSVLLINPDYDFFQEDSELPLDPLLHTEGLSPKRLAKSWPERALAELRPDFPGAIEFWPGAIENDGFHDSEAPHVRSRGRLWISGSKSDRFWSWETLEEAYVATSDAGFNPQIWEGLQASKRFPGYSAMDSSIQGLYIPKLCDVDVIRYRNGLLEYIRERLGPERVVCAAGQIEVAPGSVRFHAQGTPRTAQLGEGMLVFWTPRLTSWILSQAKKFEVTPKLPKGARLWEEWSLVSHKPLDVGITGMYGDMVVWAEVEGSPPADQKKVTCLAALRAGPQIQLDALMFPQGNVSWASGDSFGALSNLCHNFLKWDRFSVRSMRPRAILEWEKEIPWSLTKSVTVVPGCDGPIVDVVHAARKAADLGDEA